MACVEDDAWLAGAKTVMDRCARKMLKVVIDASHLLIGH